MTMTERTLKSRDDEPVRRFEASPVPGADGNGECKIVDDGGNIPRSKHGKLTPRSIDELAKAAARRTEEEVGIGRASGGQHSSDTAA